MRSLNIGSLLKIRSFERNAGNSVDKVPPNLTVWTNEFETMKFFVYSTCLQISRDLLRNFQGLWRNFAHFSWAYLCIVHLRNVAVNNTIIAKKYLSTGTHLHTYPTQKVGAKRKKNLSAMLWWNENNQPAEIMHIWISNVCAIETNIAK